MKQFLNSDLYTKVLIKNSTKSKTEEEISASVERNRKRLIDLAFEHLPDIRVGFVQNYSIKDSEVFMKHIRFVEDFNIEISSSLKRKSTPFDLSSIFPMLKFEGPYDDPFAYPFTEEEFHTVETNDPLYEVRISAPEKVLFSRKLIYYINRLDSEVNRSRNEIFNLLDKEKGNGGDIRKHMDQTEMAIRLVTKEIDQYLLECDKEDENWENIISDKRNVRKNRALKERIVFYHYVAAQMGRFWLELNARFNKPVGIEHVHLFYSMHLLRTPDTGIIDIVRAPDYDETAAKIKKARNDFGLCLNAGIFKDAIINNLIPVLLSHKLILPEDEKAVRNLLSKGGHCEDVIPWQGPYATLVHWIKGIMEIRTEKYGPLVTLPDGAKNIWKDVVSRRFLALDKDGNPCDHEKLRKAPKPHNTVYTDLVKIFQDQARKIDEFYKVY